MPRIARFFLLMVLLVSTCNGQNKAATPATKTNDSKQPTSSASAVSVPNQPNGSTLKSDTESNQQRNQPEIVIPKSLTVDIPRDNYDRFGLLVNVLLLTVGVCGIVAAVFTLRNIERQTRAAETATMVAKASMDALINKERARLRVDPPSKNLDFLVPGYVRETLPHLMPYAGETHIIKIAVFNRGLTAARDVKGSFSISITQLPVESGRASRATFPVDIGDMVPGEKPFQQDIALYGGIKQEDLEAIHNRNAILRIFGEITYADAFHPLDVRSTTFSFEWQSDKEWYEQESIRTVSDSASGWQAFPPDGNKTT